MINANTKIRKGTFGEFKKISGGLFADRKYPVYKFDFRPQEGHFEIFLTHSFEIHERHNNKGETFAFVIDYGVINLGLLEDNDEGYIIKINGNVDISKELDNNSKWLIRLLRRTYFETLGKISKYPIKEYIFGVSPYEEYKEHDHIPTPIKVFKVMGNDILNLHLDHHVDLNGKQGEVEFRPAGKYSMLDLLSKHKFNISTVYSKSEDCTMVCLQDAGSILNLGIDRERVAYMAKLEGLWSTEELINHFEENKWLDKLLKNLYNEMLIEIEAKKAAEEEA